MTIYAIYGVCIQESFHFVDKNTLEIVKTLSRYDSEVITIYYANDEDLD